MTSYPAVGYVSAYLLTTENELSALRCSVAAFAQKWAFALHSIHVEEPPRTLAAFQALIEQLTTDNITTVLVPSLHHFAAIGNPLEIKELLEQLIGSRVIATTRPRSLPERKSDMTTTCSTRPWGVRRASACTRWRTDEDALPTSVKIDPETQLGVYLDQTGQPIQAGPPKHGTQRVQFKCLTTGGGDGARPGSTDDTKIVEYVPD